MLRSWQFSQVMKEGYVIRTSRHYVVNKDTTREERIGDYK